jgi:hypothetical protein
MSEFTFFLVHTGRYSQRKYTFTFTIYKVCLKSNAIGTTNFFINNWIKNQHHPLQSSSLGKPHTARDVPTPNSSVGSLHVEVPSGGLSQPFGCYPQFQNVVVMQHPSVHSPSSLGKLSWMVWWLKFNSLLIILTVKCQSDLMTAITLVTFSSIVYVQGLPERGSSSTISWPSKMLYAI